jgi:hypothetical protein
MVKDGSLMSSVLENFKNSVPEHTTGIKVIGKLSSYETVKCIVTVNGVDHILHSVPDWKRDVCMTVAITKMKTDLDSDLPLNAML